MHYLHDDNQLCRLRIIQPHAQHLVFPTLANVSREKTFVSTHSHNFMKVFRAQSSVETLFTEGTERPFTEVFDKHSQGVDIYSAGIEKYS